MLKKLQQYIAYSKQAYWNWKSNAVKENWILEDNKSFQTKKQVIWHLTLSVINLILSLYIYIFSLLLNNI